MHVRIKKGLIYCLFFLGFCAQLRAQAPVYFQQEVNYKIAVRLDDEKHVLHGFEEFRYVNHSPDVLSELYIHLWPNAYATHHSRFAQQQLENRNLRFHFAPHAQRGGIDSLEFRVNGKIVVWEYTEPDVAFVHLNEPLPPGASLTFSTPFRVVLPNSFSRLGHVAKQYQVTQWYPKPAVYDKGGWRPMPYLDQGEFYSEFGTFEVTIDVPKNYVVGATGDLTDGAAEEAWLREREKLSRQKMLEPKAATNEVFKEQFAANERKKLRFIQKDIHDFAWFADKQYYILTDHVELPFTKRKVKTVALFNELQKKYWKDATQYVGQGVFYYSKWVGEYPYNHCTAVDGALSAGGGMEYPNITVVSAGGSASSLQEVIIHEVGHNWFYGMLGSNERDFPWMDEGCNSFYEHRTMDAVSVEIKQNGKRNYAYGGFKVPLPFRDSSAPLRWAYKLSPSLNIVQPIEFPSAEYVDLNYGLIVYVKSVLALRYLEAYLSRPVFDKCMQTYFERWKFKHPYPADMEAVFTEVSDKKLDWFFESYLNTAKEVDFVIDNVEEKQEALYVSASNLTGVPLCANIVVINEAGDTTQRFWSEPFMGSGVFKLEKRGKWNRVEINPGELLPERHINNNVYYNRPVFAKFSKPGVGFIYGLEDPHKRKAYALPAIGYNTTDGFMAGGLLHYQFFPRKNFEFHLLPMVGFRNGKFAGSGGATYRFFIPKVLRKIELHSRTALFANFLHTKNFVEFHFRPLHPRINMQNVITFRTHHLAYRKNEGGIKTVDGYRPYYAALDWRFNHNRTSFEYGLNFEIGMRDKDAIRTSVSPHFRLALSQKSELKVRAFAGTFIQNNNVPYALQYRLNGSFDPFGENIYLDRSGRSNWLNNQIFEDQGGFRSLTAVSSSTWLTTANFSLRTLGGIVGVYANVGSAGNSTLIEGGFDDDPQFFYDGGLSLHLGNNMLNVYFPIVGSVYADDLPVSFSQFGRNIVFSIQLNNLTKIIPYFE